jgi:hypothetical protein
VIPAQWAGGYTIDHFDHFECCVTGTNDCRRTDTTSPIALDHPYRGLVGGVGPLPPGVTPDAVADTRAANALLAGILQRPGFIDERDDAVCYVTDGASVCEPLPARPAVPPRTPRHHDAGALILDATNDDTATLVEDANEGEGLIAEVAVPDAVCAGDVFAVDVAAFSPSTRVRINGHIGTAAVIAAPGPKPSPVVVFARDERGAEQLIARNVDVVDCGPVDTVQRLAAKRLPFQADAFRFSLDTLSGDPNDDGLVDPVVYAWDFGDGSKATTTTPTVQHDYARRVQRHEGDAFVVSVTAIDAEGSTTTTQVSVHLKNTFAAAANVSGVWTLRGDVQQQRPRFKAGAVIADVEVSNIAPRGPFVAHTAQVVMHPCDRTQKPTATTLKAGAINGAFVVDSGASQTLRVKIPVPTTLTTEVCRYDLAFEGTLEGKTAAVVPVSLETGPFVGVGTSPGRVALLRRFSRLVARFGDTTGAEVGDAIDAIDATDATDLFDDAASLLR